MFKKSKASPATQSVSVAGSRASEKKEKNSKKRNKSIGRRIWYGFGYTLAIGFILISVYQSTDAFSYVNTANIVYVNESVRIKAEKEKARQAIANELDVDIDNDNIITANDDDNNIYYIDEDGNITCIDENGEATVYYVCAKCDKCGDNTVDEALCSKCGSDLRKYVVYQVEAGDTLAEVSGKIGASVNSIANLNELDDVNLIYAGESLRIPE